MTYLEHELISDEAQRLYRGRPARRRVDSGVRSSKSRPVGVEMSGRVPKDDAEVRSLTESLSRSDRKLVFKL